MTPRVLHCITSLHVGGAGRLLLSNLEALCGRGFDASVAYLVPRHDLLPSFAAGGWEVECLDHRGARDAPRTLARLLRRMDRQRVALVHTHLWLDRLYGGVAAALQRRPVVTTLHSAGFPKPAEGADRPLPSRLRSTVEDLVARRTTRCFVAVSAAVKRFHVEERGVPENRIEVIHSGVPVAAVEAAEPPPGAALELRAALGLEPEAPVLLHVGRLSPEKGQDAVIRALPRVRTDHPGTVLLLVGEGGDRNRLRDLARRLGVEPHVRFLGQRGDVYPLLYLADLFVYTPAPGEGLGLALLEAMAAARPVVASRSPALAEVIAEGESGHLADAQDAGELASRVSSLLAQPERRQDMGARGRGIVRERFDASRAAAHLADLYRRVLSTQTSAAEDRP